MRKIVAGLFMSLDGVVEAPENWHFPYLNEEMGAVVGSGMADADTMLLGRTTYEIFSAYWPNQGKEEQFADQINNIDKVVVSTTLKSAEWQNTTVLSGKVEEGIAELKQRPGRNIQITGSIALVRSLLGYGLLDELSLLLHPIVVGSGQRLFEEGTDRRPLELVDSKTLRTGVLHLTYRPESR